MKPDRWARVALRSLAALHNVRRVAGDALGADLPHSQLVCALAEVRDLAARALRRRPRRKAA